MDRQSGTTTFLSFAFYNNEADVEALLKALLKAMRKVQRYFG